MIRRDRTRTPRDLLAGVDRLFALSAAKIQSLDRSWSSTGTPVFTVDGNTPPAAGPSGRKVPSTAAAILQFDATGDASLASSSAGERTLRHMAPHVTHVGVHDHGFNNLSTYGNLRRLDARGAHRRTTSGVRTSTSWRSRSAAPCRRRGGRRSSTTPLGYVYSFNGPHSLFIDTMRTIRVDGPRPPARPRADGRERPRINLLRAHDHARAHQRPLPCLPR